MQIDRRLRDYIFDHITRLFSIDTLFFHKRRFCIRIVESVLILIIGVSKNTVVVESINVLVKKAKLKRPLREHKPSKEGNIKRNLNEKICGFENGIQLPREKANSNVVVKLMLIVIIFHVRKIQISDLGKVLDIFIKRLQIYGDVKVEFN
jgi:hypothetical protein